jgi:hypothetical protein
MGNAWILGSAADEAATDIDSVWDGDEFVPVANINDAQIYGEGQFSTEQVRGIQGGFQSQFTDRDVRMRRVTVTVALA